MLLIGVGSILVLAAAAIVRGMVFVRVERERMRRGWFWGLLLLGMVGAAAGTFGVEYPLSPTERVIGFPIPGAIRQVRNGQWVDYVSPLFWLNFVLVPGVFVLPVTWMMWRRWRREQLDKKSRGFEVITRD